MFIQKISAVNSSQSNSVAKNSFVQHQKLALPKELSHDTANFSNVSFKGDCGAVETTIMLACASTGAAR